MSAQTTTDSDDDSTELQTIIQSDEYADDWATLRERAEDDPEEVETTDVSDEVEQAARDLGLVEYDEFSLSNLFGDTRYVKVQA